MASSGAAVGAVPSTVHGVRLPLIGDDSAAGPGRALPSKTSFGIHVLDDDMTVFDPQEGDASAAAHGGTLHGGKLAAIVAEATEASRRAPHDRSSDTRANTATAISRSDSWPIATNAAEAPPTTAAPRTVSSGNKTSLGIAAITSDKDPVQPVSSQGLELNDDWLDDIQLFIDEKVADGSLNIPGATPSAAGTVELRPKPSSASASTVSTSASSVMPSPSGMPSSSDSMSLDPSPISPEDIAPSPPPKGDVAGFGIVRKRRSKKVVGASTGPVATVGTTDRRSMVASAGAMQDKVDTNYIPEEAAARAQAEANGDGASAGLAPVRPAPADQTQPGRPVEELRGPGDRRGSSSQTGPAAVPSSAFPPSAHQGGTPGGAKATMLGVALPADLQDAASVGFPPAAPTHGSGGVDERTMAFSPATALEVAREAGQASTPSAPAVETPGFLRDAADSGALPASATPGTQPPKAAEVVPAYQHKPRQPVKPVPKSGPSPMVLLGGAGVVLLVVIVVAALLLR